MLESNLVRTNTELPQLEELGFEDFTIHNSTAFPFKGGEQEAKKRIQNYFWDSHKLAFYKKTRNGLIGVNYSSKLSACWQMEVFLQEPSIGKL